MTATITVHRHPQEETNALHPEDQGHFMKTFNRAMRMCSDSVSSIDIYLGTRVAGWLEHRIVVSRCNGTTTVIGAIQRESGAESEFCS